MEPQSLQDLLSEEGRRDPYTFYAKLHQLGEAAPLVPSESYQVVAFGYSAVDKLMRDPNFRMLDSAYLDRSGTRWREHPAVRILQDSMFFANGPEHLRVRRLFSQAFTARHVAALEPAIIGIIERLLDRLAQLGSGGAPVDFMAEFALPMPSDVVGELLGVPDADRPWFPQRVRTFGQLLEIGHHSWREVTAADAAAVELAGYFADLIKRRQADPREDIVSTLAQVQAQRPDELSETELIANLITMFNAGFVTTTHLLGNALTLLLERPADLARVRTDPKFAAMFVEEVLRFEPPVHFGVRYAEKDCQVGGVDVPAGASVLVLMGAANRDPRRFPDPDTFDPNRADNHPLSFGAGPHYCLGAPLSRLEGLLALPRLLDRFPDLALAGEPGVRNQLMLRGYDHLPVRLTRP